jgi:sortase A
MSLTRKIGIALIILGVLIIAVATYMHLTAERKSNEMVQAYLSYINDISDTGSEPDTEQTTQQSATEAVTKPMTIPEGMIGIVTIDKISMSAPLVDGTDNKSIRYALGHFKNTAMPGEVGNFAVAGHRSYTFGEYFNRLDEMAVGDEIKVLYGNKQYKYIVDDVSVVEPQQVEVLDETDTPTITLVTCTPKWTATHRLIVKGYLAEEDYAQ